MIGHNSSIHFFISIPLTCWACSPIAANTLITTLGFGSASFNLGIRAWEWDVKKRKTNKQTNKIDNKIEVKLAIDLSKVTFKWPIFQLSSLRQKLLRWLIVYTPLCWTFLKVSCSKFQVHFTFSRNANGLQKKKIYCHFEEENGLFIIVQASKRSTLSFKRGKKWDFCRRVKGVRYKKSTFGVQKVLSFWVPHPKIDPGCRPVYS